jgi:phage replication initiation protein
MLKKIPENALNTQEILDKVKLKTSSSDLSSFFDAPFSWLPPSHSALAPFNPARFPHQAPKIDRPTLVIRGLTPNSNVNDESSVQVLTKNGFFVDSCLPDETANDDCAHIDTLSIVFNIDNYVSLSDMVFSSEDLLASLSNDFAHMVGIKISSDNRGSRNFYKNSNTLVYCDNAEGVQNNKMLGFIAYGGNNNTCQIYLNGEACEYIGLQANGWNQVKKWGESIYAKITRADLAYDDVTGAHFNVRDVNDMVLAGLFNNPNGGRRPCTSQVGDWLNNDPEGKGLTAYVGSRSSSRMFRMYDKGKEQGDPLSPWVRVELELKSVNFYVPWDVLTETGKYLAGSCKALNVISDEHISLKNIQKQKAKATVEKMIQTVKYQYGKLINALSGIGYSPEKIISVITRDGIPKSLEFTMSEKMAYDRSHPEYFKNYGDPFGMLTV